MIRSAVHKHTSPAALARLFFIPVITVIVASGCSLQRYIPPGEETCDVRPILGSGLSDYLDAHDQSRTTRLAIFPFEVPTSFVGTGPETLHFGFELARRLHAEILAFEPNMIAEVFPRRSYPGKRTDFITGNHEALQNAQQAGYDVFIIGMMLPQHDESTIEIELKLIETQLGITLWTGTVTVSSNSLDTYRTWSKTRLVDEVPSNFPFESLTRLFARCAAAAVYQGKAAPESET